MPVPLSPVAGAFEAAAAFVVVVDAALVVVVVEAAVVVVVEAAAGVDLTLRRKRKTTYNRSRSRVTSAPERISHEIVIWN